MEVLELLKKGISAHRDGDLSQAQVCYNTILKEQPNHPDANHNLGVLAVGANKAELALPLFKRALEANPSIPQFWVSIIDALLHLKRFEDARHILAQAKERGIQHVKLETQLKQIEELEVDTQTEKFGAMDQRRLSHSNAKDVPKAQLSAIVEMYKKRHFNEALQEINALIKTYPHSPALHNLGAACCNGKGDYQEAVGHCQSSIKLDPSNPEAHYNLGLIFRKSGQFLPAIKSLEDATALNENFSEAYNELGLAHQDCKQFDKAIAAFEKAITIRPDFAEALNNCGNAYLAVRDFTNAKKYFENAVSASPSNAKYLHNLGITYKSLGKVQKSIILLKQAVSQDDNYAIAFFNLGIAHIDYGEIEEARCAFQRCVSITPGYIEAHCQLLELLENTNQIDDMEKHFLQAKKDCDPTSDDLHSYEILLSYRKKEYSKALELGNKIDLNNLRYARRLKTLMILGKCADKSAMHDTAFKYFTQMSDVTKLSPSYENADAERYLNGIRDYNNVLRTFSSMDEAARRTDGFNPVFLVGFPRSGTTLLDTILRSHSKISVVEEKPALLEASKLILDTGSFNFLDKVPPDDVRDTGIKKYNELLLGFIDDDELNPQIIIDKYPLNLTKLPLINCLFPNAKIIFAIRNPLDVIWSNWTQNFKLNPAMANMVDLQTLAEFYSLSMSIGKQAIAKLGMCVHEVRYEDLVVDMKSETTSLLEFLDLSWEDNLLNYQVTASQRVKINTPSYDQVIQPLYTGSINRWRAYETHLKPHIETVKPWIKEFGYDY
jgi:tetratricopeptide (TPR) repeat protein